jgi:hypothetical protein
MAVSHQPGEERFRAIRSEEITCSAFEASAATARLAVQDPTHDSRRP